MDKNTTEFQNPLHKRLWQMSVHYRFAERAMERIADETLRESCVDLYHYVTDAYDDIFRHPQEYGIDPDAGPENFAEEKRLSEKINFHLNILCNPLRRSYGSFLDFAVDRQSECLILRASDYDKLMKNVRNKTYNAIKIFEDKGVFEKLASTLSRRGLCMERSDQEVVIRNTKYPQMFLAADLLFQEDVRYHTKTKRSPQYFNLLDFGVLCPDRYEWDLEDVVGGMYDDQKANVYRLVDFLSEKVKLKASYTVWYDMTAVFTYKRKDILRIRWSNGIEISLPVIPPDSEQFAVFEKEIEKLENSREIKEYYRIHIKRCRYCSEGCMKTNSYKKAWSFFGRPLDRLIKSCDQRVAVYQFDETDLAHFKAILGIYLALYTGRA